MASMVLASAELISLNPNCSYSSLVGGADPSRLLGWGAKVTYFPYISLVFYRNCL